MPPAPAKGELVHAYNSSIIVILIGSIIRRRWLVKRSTDGQEKWSYGGVNTKIKNKKTEEHVHEAKGKGAVGADRLVESEITLLSLSYLCSETGGRGGGKDTTEGHS